MPVSFLNALIYPLLTIVAGLIAWLIKTLVLNEIDELKSEMKTKISDQIVRELIADKLDPLKEDIIEVKQNLQKLVDMQLRKE